MTTSSKCRQQLCLFPLLQGNKLATAYHYIRSMAVKHPFPAAELNLHKFYERISKEKDVANSRQVLFSLPSCPFSYETCIQAD